MLRGLIETHARETGSRYAALLLHDWETLVDRFWHIVPAEYVKYLPAPLTDDQEALRA